MSKLTPENRKYLLYGALGTAAIGAVILIPIAGMHVYSMNKKEKRQRFVIADVFRKRRVPVDDVEVESKAYDAVNPEYDQLDRMYKTY